MNRDNRQRANDLITIAGVVMLVYGSVLMSVEIPDMRKQTDVGNNMIMRIGRYGLVSISSRFFIGSPGRYVF